MSKSLRVSLSLLAIVLISGCARRSIQPNPSSKSVPYYHLVRYPGETLGLLAKWYTGDVKNWEKIKLANPNLNPSRIEIGDSVVIPEDILVKREKLPQDFVISDVKNVPDNAPAEPATINSAQEEIVPPTKESNPETSKLAPATEELIKTRDDLWRELMGE